MGINSILDAKVANLVLNELDRLKNTLFICRIFVQKPKNLFGKFFRKGFRTKGFFSPNCHVLPCPKITEMHKCMGENGRRNEIFAFLAGPIIPPPAVLIELSCNFAVLRSVSGNLDPERS